MNKVESEVHEAASIKFNPDKTILLISGKLNFMDVVELRVTGKRLMDQIAGSQVIIDLQGITSSDNSGLVLLVAWVRDAHAENKSIVFQNEPASLSRMAQVFGLQSLLFEDLSQTKN